jgi:Ca-activated chloride channel family protein
VNEPEACSLAEGAQGVAAGTPRRPDDPASPTRIVPGPAARTAAPADAPAGRPGALPDQRGVLPDHPGALPDHPDALPDHPDAPRRTARVLLLLDVSGSMNEPAGDGRSRLAAAQEAALTVLDLLRPDDEVGLWTFSAGTPGPTRRPYRELVPPTPLAAARGALGAAVESLAAAGGTALYTTVRAAHDHLLAGLDPCRANAVVLLTDGRNDDPGDNDLDALLRDIDDGETEPSVRVFPVAFSPDADVDVLTEIADASRATVYDARDPAAVGRALRSVLGAS